MRSSADWFWETDATLALAQVSPAATAHLEMPSQQLIGRRLPDLIAVTPEERTAGLKVPALGSTMLARRAFRQTPVRLQLSAERQIRCGLSGVPYYDSQSGEFLGYRGTATHNDHLEAGQPSANETNRRLLALLEAALSRKDKLEHEREESERADSWARMASIAHELRTPLNAILGFSEIIRDWRFGDNEGRYREYGSVIHDSGLHLLDVVNDLLELTDKEKRLAAHQGEPVDPIKVAAFVLIVLEEKAQEMGIVLVNKLPEALPFVAAERRAVRQILLNLLTNALRYTPSGGEVYLESEVVGDERLLLRVRDTGIGIAPEEQERIFERYYRAAGSEGAQDGKGLGLAISRDLARSLDGEITVESKLGEGSCFTLHLPIAGEPEGPGGEKPEAEEPGEAATDRPAAGEKGKKRARRRA